LNRRDFRAETRRSTVQTVEELAFRLALFYVVLFLGVLANKLYSRAALLNQLSTSLLLNIMLPALIIYTFLSSSASSLVEIPTIILVVVLMHVTGTGLALIRFRYTSIESKQKGALLLTATFTNSVFLAIPIIIIFVGTIGVQVAAICAVVQMVLLSTLGVYIGAIYGENQTDRRKHIRKALLFPPFVATLITIPLVLLGFSLPVQLEPVLSANNTITTYLALFIVGLGLDTRVSTGGLKRALEMIGIRQVMIPIIFFVVLPLLPLSDFVTRVLLIQAIMPAAVLTVVYSEAFDLDAKLAAMTVTLGTFLVLPAIPFLSLLVG